MIRYDAAAGHVVLVECHHSVLSMIRAVLPVVELWGGGVVKKLLYLQVPGIYIVMNWLAQHSIDQYTLQKCRKYIHSCFCFFLSHLHVLSAHYFLKLPLFRNSYPGSRGTHSSPFPTAVRSFVLIARKKGSELSFLPWSPLASNWCTFMQATSIIRSTRAARRFLRSVCILLLWFQA